MPEITEEDWQEYLLSQEEQESEADPLLESIADRASEMDYDMD